MFDQERFEKQLAFIREIDKEKMIKRQSYITDCETRENDADHAWHMAIMTVLLSEYSNEKIDVLKTMTMLLIHDLVEVYAGDTYPWTASSHLSLTMQQMEEHGKNIASSAAG